MINQLAIVAPIHYPKIKWLQKLVDSYNEVKPDIDLYIVVSEEESHLLAEYRNIHENIIVCPNVNNSRSPVTYKKMYGLHEVYKLNKYIGYACIDSESEFLKSNLTFQDSFENFYYNQEIICYPTDVDFLINIQKESAAIYPENEELRKFKNLYSVWNTIPWFIDLYLPLYFQESGFYNNYFKTCPWEVFDQLNFQAWLVSKGLFKISDTQYRLEYPEDMPVHERRIFNDVRVDWIRLGAKNLECFKNQSPLMYFHTDRN